MSIVALSELLGASVRDAGGTYVDGCTRSPSRRRIIPLVWHT